MIKEQLKRCEHGQDEVNFGSMERGENDDCDMKRQILEKQNNGPTSELYDSDVNTPVGKFFYHNNVCRAERHDRTGKGHEDYGVDACGRTVTTMDNMDGYDKTSTINKRDTVSY